MASTVETSTDLVNGAAMPPSLDTRIARLMCDFSQLTPHGQRRFMDVLNLYLYASPVQRRQLRRDWQDLPLPRESCVKKSD